MAYLRLPWDGPNLRRMLDGLRRELDERFGDYGWRIDVETVADGSAHRVELQATEELGRDEDGGRILEIYDQAVTHIDAYQLASARQPANVVRIHLDALATDIVGRHPTYKVDEQTLHHRALMLWNLHRGDAPPPTLFAYTSTERTAMYARYRDCANILEYVRTNPGASTPQITRALNMRAALFTNHAWDHARTALLEMGLLWNRRQGSMRYWTPAPPVGCGDLGAERYKERCLERVDTLMPHVLERYGLDPDAHGQMATLAQLRRRLLDAASYEVVEWAWGSPPAQVTEHELHAEVLCTEYRAVQLDHELATGEPLLTLAPAHQGRLRALRDHIRNRERQAGWRLLENSTDGQETFDYPGREKEARR